MKNDCIPQLLSTEQAQKDVQDRVTNVRRIGGRWSLAVFSPAPIPSAIVAGIDMRLGGTSDFVDGIPNTESVGDPIRATCATHIKTRFSGKRTKGIYAVQVSMALSAISTGDPFCRFALNGDSYHSLAWEIVSDMESYDEIEKALEIIEFHARSTNRVMALDVLTDGPIERRDLEERTTISRPTLSRILDEFERRGWIIEDRHRYEVTQLGRFVNQEFMRLIDRVAVVHTLQEVVQWFPDDDYRFDLSCLSAADIVRPSKEDALAPTNNIVKRLEAAERVQILSYTVLPVCFEACWRKVVDGSQTLDLVFDSSAFATIEKSSILMAAARDMVDSESATILRYDQDLPYVVIITEEAVNLCLSGEDGAPRAVIDTTDEVVRSWAETTFKSYHSQATPIEPAAFTT